MLGAALFGIILRFSAVKGIINLSPEIISGLPQLPKDGLLIIPTEPLRSMVNQTLFVSIKNIKNLFNPQAIVVILTFLFLDFFGTATTLSAAASQIPNIPRKDFENNKRIYLADALGSFVGSLFGTSNLSTYIESVSGIINGARTGLMSVVTALLFILSMFFYPLLSLVTPAVTTPAMVLIGIFMMQNITNIDWHSHFEEIVPAFITIVMMPLSGSIALGLSLGFISYEILMIFAGRKEELPNIMHFITLVSLAYLFTL